MRLIVRYELNGVIKTTEADELCRVRDGFWIDESGNFCQSMKAESFILPHMIKEIRKGDEDGEN